MLADKDIFFDEWRACLHAHYLYVVRTQDHVTEPTLRTVLIDAGVPEDEIEAWYQEAIQSGRAEAYRNASEYE
ncbi:MAG: hypothetical protein GYB66_09000 [Chloroflexi bacterium]|nr:hypothetical protein [Chloroflexota bacterium]